MTSTVYAKIIGKNRGNYPYKLGLNTLEDNGETFNPEPKCTSGGLYYTSLEHILYFSDYGDKLCIVRPAEDAQVVDIRNDGVVKYKTDRLLIEEMKELWSVDTFEWLVSHVDIHTNDERALRSSAEYGQLEVVKYLVEEHGADVHAWHDYALRESAGRGHLDVVKYLVEHGADVHVDDDYALRLSAVLGHMEMVKYLVEHGADVHADDDYALRKSAGRGHLDVVKYLVEHGADVHAKDDYALRLSAHGVHLDVVKYLVEHGADIHALDNRALRLLTAFRRRITRKYRKLRNWFARR